MSTYSNDLQKRLQIAQAEERREKKVQEEIENEVEMFYQASIQDIPIVSPEMEIFARNSAKNTVNILRGFKARLEQYGAYGVRAATLAQQAWDCTQVTSEVMVRKLLELNGIDFNVGFKSTEEADHFFRKVTEDMVKVAQDLAAEGKAATMDSQTKSVLNHLTDNNIQDLSELPNVKDLLKGN